MHRTTRIVASTLAVAALGVAGAQSGAQATSATSTCSHGVVTPSSGHNHGVEYVSSRDVEDAHIHNYKHMTGFTPHYRERTASEPCVVAWARLAPGPGDRSDCCPSCVFPPSSSLPVASSLWPWRSGCCVPASRRRPFSATRNKALPSACTTPVSARSGSLTLDQVWSPRDRALERCWSGAAKDPQFQRLALVDPIAEAKKLRDEGFKAWRCAERSGYVRTSKIPLSGPSGYPLQLAAGNFRVGSSHRDLERFYRAAAKCSGDSIDAYRWSDGTFNPDPADGKRCHPPHPQRQQQARPWLLRHRHLP